MERTLRSPASDAQVVEERRIILSISKMYCSNRHILLDAETKDMPKVSHGVVPYQGVSVTFTDSV